jgi:hypothetical protein
VAGQLHPGALRVGGALHPLARHAGGGEQPAEPREVLHLLRRHAELHELAALDEHAPGGVGDEAARRGERRVAEVLPARPLRPAVVLPQLYLRRLAHQREREGGERGVDDGGAIEAGHGAARGAAQGVAGLESRPAAGRDAERRRMTTCVSLGTRIPSRCSATPWRRPAAGRRAHVALEGGALGEQLQTRALELRELACDRDAVAAPPHHRARDEHEGEEQREHDRPAAWTAAAAGQPARCHTRSRALRARGLRALSSPDASTPFRVTSAPSAVPPHVHAGARGGHVHAALHARNACFTSRSSPEW